MKYIFASILAFLAIWSLVAWRITPDTRARQHVLEVSLSAAQGWRNLPESPSSALTARVESVCEMRPTGDDGLHLLVGAGADGYDRVALCAGRDYAGKLAEARVSSWAWTEPFDLELIDQGKRTGLPWRMNVRHLSPDGSKLLVYLSHVFEQEGTRPLQQVIYAGVAAPAERRVPLTWLSDPNPQRRPQIEAFNRRFPECFLRLDTIDTGGGVLQKVIVQTCSGVGPSIIDVYGIHQLQMFVNAGILLRLDKHAKRMGLSPDVSYPKAAPGMRVGGEQYCFPCNVNVRILIYNKNLFDRYDVPYPPTDRVIDWLEFIEKYGKPLTARRPGRPVPDCFGLAFEKEGWQDIFYQAGGRIYGSDGTRCVVDSPEGIAGIRMYRNLMHTYGVMPSAAQQNSMSGQGGWGQGWMNWFGGQKVACIRIGKWALITFRRYIAEQRRRFAKRFPGVTPPTDLDELRAWTQRWMIDHPDPVDWPPLRLGAMHVPRMSGRRPLVLLTQRSAAVNRLHPHWRDALKFLEYLAGEEYCQTINDGADALPGNRTYATIERQIHPDWPEERDIHVLTNQATEWGHVREVSPFLDALVMDRLTRTQIQRLEADPDFTAEQAMRIAAKDVNDAIQRNLRNDAKLRKRYDELVRAPDVSCGCGSACLAPPRAAGTNPELPCVGEKNRPHAAGLNSVPLRPAMTMAGRASR